MKQGEHRVCQALNAAGSHVWLRLPLQWISRLGNGAIWYAAMAALIVFAGIPGLEVAVQMAVTGLAGTIIYLGMKFGFRRLRPCERYSDIRGFTQPMDRFSFPSGHSLHAVSFSLMLTAAVPTLGLFLFAFTGLIAVSRVVLGHHYLTDVLVGITLGLVVAKISMAIHPIQALLLNSS